MTEKQPFKNMMIIWYIEQKKPENILIASSLLCKKLQQRQYYWHVCVCVFVCVSLCNT